MKKKNDWDLDKFIRMTEDLAENEFKNNLDWKDEESNANSDNEKENNYMTEAQFMQTLFDNGCDTTSDCTDTETEHEPDSATSQKLVDLG